MTMIRFATYDLLDYGQKNSADENARYERVHHVLRDLVAAATGAGEGFVLAVQELIAAE